MWLLVILSCWVFEQCGVQFWGVGLCIELDGKEGVGKIWFVDGVDQLVVVEKMGVGWQVKVGNVVVWVNVGKYLFYLFVL